jgi:thiopurine S-methyltransferase
VEPEFWHKRWRLGQIGFHQSTVDRHLQAYWPAFNLPAGSRVFVPLCGKSLDLKWLHERGHAVVGVEISSAAVERFCLEQGILARRRLHAGFEIFEAERLQLFCGDFFALTPALLKSVAAVYDRASLIAWPPEMRAPYVEHITRLTDPGTPTLLIAAEYPQVQMQGPPFSVTRDVIDRLYLSHHSIDELGRYEFQEIEPRLKARGLTELREVCYRLTRL